jgi:OOP family OmpA-OmpF porin
MSSAVKILIGFAATLIMGWIWHAPLGRGEGFVQQLETQARASIAPVGIAGVDVRLSRSPLSRAAILSGPANDLQREGLGSEMGLSDYVRAVPGVGSVRWADERRAAGGLPLLAETLIQLTVAFLLGLGLGSLLFGRRRRSSFLD